MCQCLKFVGVKLSDGVLFTARYFGMQHLLTRCSDVSVTSISECHLDWESLTTWRAHTHVQCVHKCKDKWPTGDAPAANSTVICWVYLQPSS